MAMGFDALYQYIRCYEAESGKPNGIQCIPIPLEQAIKPRIISKFLVSL